MKKKEKLKILFLCIGNACRSQIAEGWARYLKNESIEAYSAGVIPSGLNEYAVKVMASAGVDISKQASKHVDTLKNINFDYVITLCNEQYCPSFNGKTKHIHMPFDDPTFLPLAEPEKIAAFMKLRDQLKSFVEKMPDNLRELEK
jgi:arsenate reductase